MTKRERRYHSIRRIFYNGFSYSEYRYDAPLTKLINDEPGNCLMIPKIVLRVSKKEMKNAWYNKGRRPFSFVLGGYYKPWKKNKIELWKKD